jgi:D-aminopeptidase
MLVFISVDMEGISALERVHEITPGKGAHGLFCKLMAGDANAVIDGAIAGAERRTSSLTYIAFPQGAPDRQHRGHTPT